MSILKTKEYNQFRVKPENRPLNEFNVKRLINSISSKNMLDDKPIIVDKELHVIDGQHRLEAARRLQIEIYYKINESSTSEDIILLNANQKSWQLTDYLNYYCQREYPDYVLLDDFCKKNKLSLMHVRALMNENESFSDKFKCGKFQFPSNESYFQFEKKLADLRYIQDYIEKKLPDTKICYTGSHFMHALLEFLNNKNVDVNTFINKLELKLEIMRPSTNRIGYMSMFKTIYNWKNHNPIEVE